MKGESTLDLLEFLQIYFCVSILKHCILSSFNKKSCEGANIN